MAYTKILVVHNRLDKSVDYALNEEKTSLEYAIDYALNRDKTEKTCFETAINCDISSPYEDMMATKQRWGKVRRIRQGYHIIQSFVPGETTPEQAHAIGVEFARRLLGDKYEVVVGTHLDKAHLHNHIVFNSVSFVDGSMFKDTMRDYYQGIRGTSDTICREQGLSVIEPDEDSPARSRPEWEDKPSVRDTVRMDIDAALLRAYTFGAFLLELRRMGYTVNVGNRKHISIRPPGGGRNIRLDSLGEGYTQQDLTDRLAAMRSGEPRQAAPTYLPIHAGRRYRVKGGERYRPRRLSGFRRLCFRYLLLLNGVKHGKAPARVPYSVRREVARLDRYQRQFRYLQENRIDTAGQLSMQYDGLQAEIDALVDERRELYNRKRRGDDTAQPQIAEITGQLRPLRRQLRLCLQIEEDMERIRRTMQEAGRTDEPARGDGRRKRKEMVR